MNNHTTVGGPTEPSKDVCRTPPADTNASMLTPLIEAGYELIPLRRGEKSPQDKNWNRRLYKNEEQVRHMTRGANVGVRLRASDLV